MMTMIMMMMMINMIVMLLLMKMSTRDMIIDNFNETRIEKPIPESKRKCKRQNTNRKFAKCYLNSCGSTFGDGVRDGGTRRVNHGHQTEETKTFQREVNFFDVEFES